MAVILVGCGPAPRVQVELLEDEAAQVVEPSGRAWVLPRAALPPHAREGDVLVDGQVDPAATEELRRRVREARARLREALTDEPGR